MELGQELRVVDYAEGWRVWCVRETPSGLELTSVVHDADWPIGRELVACCVDGAHGIHAARDPAAIWSYLRGRDEPGVIARVLGRVALTGRVIEHEHGWRGERAYPLSFVTDDARMQSLLDANRVRVRHARERHRVRDGRTGTRA